MNWEEVCAHPSLQNLPFKIELNEFGKVIMSPVQVSHSIYQARINSLMNKQMKNGTTLVECAINTRKGVRAADVAWASEDRLNIIKNEIACSIAPEICVEVFSPGNTMKEMREKRELYFESGAEEVWNCDEEGNMAFHSAEMPLVLSKLMPEFPKIIKI